MEIVWFQTFLELGFWGVLRPNQGPGAEPIKFFENRGL